MKPLVLIMKNFGTFIDQTIDFSTLKESLYLITGDTGAGKTTIFDAIMIALFGEASGANGSKDAKKNGRSFEVMHSDFVAKSEPASVYLKFEQDGRIHEVKRTLKFRKERASGEYKSSTVETQFTEEGKTPIEVNVNARIVDLIGLNADQFRKIVMLAQGEFKEFLKADSTKKNEILGKLFDNSEYVYFQKVLSEVKAKLSLERKDLGSDQLDKAVKEFSIPEDMEEDERIAIHAANPDLIPIISSVLISDEEKIKNLKEQIEIQNKESADIITRKTEAELVNEAIKKLEDARKCMEELEADKDEKTALKKKIDIVQKIQNNYIPSIKTYRDTKKDEDGNVIDIKNNLIDEAENKRKLEEIESDYNNLDAKRAEKQDLFVKLESLKKVMDKYEFVRKATEELDGLKSEQTKREKDLKQISSEIENLRKKFQDYKEQTKGMGDVGVEQSEAKNLYDFLSKKDEKVSSLKREYENLQTEQEEINKEEFACVKLIENARVANKIYNDLYQKYLDSQAAVLSTKLRNEIIVHGKSSCPVCKTTIEQSMLSSLFAGDEVDGDELRKLVDEAKLANDEADDKQADESRKLESKKSRFDEKKKSFVINFSETYERVCDWDSIIKDSLMVELEADVTEQLKKSKERSIKADAAVGEYAKLEENINQCEKLLNELIENQDKNRIDYEGLKTSIEVKKSEITNVKKDLSYESRMEAEGVLVKKQEEYDNLATYIERIEKKYSELSKESSRIQGEKKQLAETERLIKQKITDAEEAVNNSLVKCELSNTDEADAIIDSLECEIETWLQAKNVEIDTYTQKYQECNSIINERSKDTEGKVVVDITTLNEKLVEIKMKQDELTDKRDVLLRMRDNHKNCYETIVNAKAVLAQTEKAWKRIEKLSDLANATDNTEGGKITFDRFVMGDIFQEVLASASERLNEMSGGRYELHHRMEGKVMNKAAGLEINVYDYNTNKERDSVSLSGGESFMASLSLALGLSDVVQKHAGGKCMDALFVDEGFGTLDEDILDKAIHVLDGLAQGKRMVGVISHVDKLDKSIGSKIIVTKGTDSKGSTLRVVN